MGKYPIGRAGLLARGAILVLDSAALITLIYAARVMNTFERVCFWVVAIGLLGLAASYFASARLKKKPRLILHLGAKRERS